MKNSTIDDSQNERPGIEPPASLIGTALAASLEQAINTALRYDPGSRNQLNAFANTCIAISTTHPSLNLYFIITTNHIDVKAYWERTVDCQLKGKLLDLVQLAGNKTQTLAHSGIEVVGNSGVLANILAIVNTLDIDWQEPLSDILGDITGPLAGKAIKHKIKRTVKNGDRALHFLGEVLSEELKLTPSPTELNNFSRDVNILRSHSERLTARIARLQSAMQTKTD